VARAVGGDVRARPSRRRGDDPAGAAHACELGRRRDVARSGLPRARTRGGPGLRAGADRRAHARWRRGRPVRGGGAGLANIHDARPRLLELCLSTPSTSIGFAAASALACLADPAAVGPLLAAFEKTPSSAVRSGLAAALGEIGDKSAIESLRRVALDSARDLPSRDRAVAALGVIAQKDDFAWTAPIQQAIDSGAATPSLKVLLDLF